MGSKILLLGFLYDFKYYADNASVMNISSSVEEVNVPNYNYCFILLRYYIRNGFMRL